MLSWVLGWETDCSLISPNWFMQFWCSSRERNRVMVSRLSGVHSGVCFVLKRIQWLSKKNPIWNLQIKRSISVYSDLKRHFQNSVFKSNKDFLLHLRKVSYVCLPVRFSWFWVFTSNFSVWQDPHLLKFIVKLTYKISTRWHTSKLRL